MSNLPHVLPKHSTVRCLMGPKETSLETTSGMLDCRARLFWECLVVCSEFTSFVAPSQGASFALPFDSISTSVPR